MLQKKPTLTVFRAALAASIIGLTFFVAACQDEKNLSEPPFSNSKYVIPPPPPPQIREVPVDEPINNVFELVEEMPTPKGGMESLYKTIGENLIYPQEAVANGIEGRVYVQFVVEVDGTLSDIKVVKVVTSVPKTVENDGTLSDIKVVKGAGNGLDEAAIEAIKTTSGQWEAGRQKGTPVNTRMVMPIMFKLN